MFATSGRNPTGYRFVEISTDALVRRVYVYSAPHYTVCSTADLTVSLRVLYPEQRMFTAATFLEHPVPMTTTYDTIQHIYYLTHCKYRLETDLVLRNKRGSTRFPNIP